MDLYARARIDLHAASDVSAPFIQGPYTRLVCGLRQPGVSLTHKPAAPRGCRRECTNLTPLSCGFAVKSVKRCLRSGLAGPLIGSLLFKTINV